MGNIGEPVRRREYVPMPESTPVEEPAIAPAVPQDDPVPVPAEEPDRELVPA